MFSKKQTLHQVKARSRLQPISDKAPAQHSLQRQATAMIRKSRLHTEALTAGDVLQLQRTIGNQAVGRLLSGMAQRRSDATDDASVDLQLSSWTNEEALDACTSASVELQKKNGTNLPDDLKAGVENLSGLSMDDVRVHYNSSKPLELQALAYTQGSEIHVGPGQEQHLPHEVWHVVQQKQGRVKPIVQEKGVKINDDRRLEQEADVMGHKSLAIGRSETHHRTVQALMTNGLSSVIQQTSFISSLGESRPALMPAPLQPSDVLQRYVGLFKSGEGLFNAPWTFNKSETLLMSSDKYPHLTLELTHLNRYKLDDVPYRGLSFKKFHYSESHDDPNRVGFKETGSNSWQPENKGQNYAKAKAEALKLMQIIGGALSDEIPQLVWRKS